MSVRKTECTPPPAYENVCLEGENEDQHIYTSLGAHQESYYTALQNKTRESLNYSEPYAEVGSTVTSLPMRPMKTGTSSVVNNGHIQGQGTIKFLLLFNAKILMERL